MSDLTREEIKATAGERRTQAGYADDPKVHQAGLRAADQWEARELAALDKKEAAGE